VAYSLEQWRALGRETRLLAGRIFLVDILAALRD